MTDALVRGFKSLAERLALEVRSELGLNAFDRLDPYALAEHLGIPVIALGDLAESGARKASLDHFLGSASDQLSALTICHGSRRLIVENPRHSFGRRSSSVAHELSHVLLEHEPGPALGDGGCRRWSQKDEDEADWLAGTLLVPRPAALRFARLSTPVAVAANNMGVSVALMEWRLNHTGARAQVQRERAARGRRR